MLYEENTEVICKTLKWLNKFKFPSAKMFKKWLKLFNENAEGHFFWEECRTMGESSHMDKENMQTQEEQAGIHTRVFLQEGDSANHYTIVQS